MNLDAVEVWPDVRMRELVELENGYPFDSSEFGPDGALPLVRIRDLTSPDFQTFIPGYAPRRIVLRNGDVVIGMDGDFNVVRWDRGPAALNQRLCLLRPRPGCDIRFVEYALPDHLRFINETQYATTVKHLSSGEILGVRISAPSIEEQRRIADFLDDQVSRIDGAVDSHAEQLKLMAQRRESALEFIVLGRNHHDVVNAGWRPFQSRPASWREGQLRSVRCDVQTGPFGSQLHAEEYVDNGWPVVNPANIGPDELIAIPECSVDENTRERLGRHVLKLGDVVFGRRGELGRAGLVTREQVGWVCGTGSLRVRLLDDQLSPDYLLRLLRTSALRYYFDTQAVGSTMANLNTGILMAMPLLLPQADEQVRIVANAREVETAHDEIERLIRSQVLLLTERKRALITAAVTGEFDVTTASGRGVA